MFGMTKLQLELISDPDMYIFFQKGMRGGVSFRLLIGSVKPASSIWNLMTQNQNQNIIYTYMQIIYIVIYNKYLFERVDSNGCFLKCLSWINIRAINQKDVF